MSRKRCTGIHYSNTEITMVLVEKDGAAYAIGNPVKVTPQVDSATEDESTETMLVDQCANANPMQNASGQVALSFSGSLYQTLQHHSDFTDVTQIQQTLRYDIEEDFAIDADTMALCFHHRPDMNQEGTDLLVHITNKNKAIDVFDHFERINMDALIAQPDITSWLCYLSNQDILKDGAPAFIVAWSNDMLYILAVDETCQPIMTRSLPCHSAKQVETILESELMRSMAALPASVEIQSMYCHICNLDPEVIDSIAKKMCLPMTHIGNIDLATAAAAGAAISQLDNNPATDFRANELMPQTLIKANNRAWMGLSAAITIFMLAWLLVFQMNTNAYIKASDDAMEKQKAAYKIAYPDNKLPGNLAQIPRNIRNRLTELNSLTTKITDSSLPDSASNTFRLFFEALNYLPEDFDLIIDNVSFQSDTITFNGSVPDLIHLEQLRNAILQPETLLEIDSTKFTDSTSSKSQTASRRAFSMPLRIKKPDIPDDDEKPKRRRVQS